MHRKHEYSGKSIIRMFSLACGIVLVMALAAPVSAAPDPFKFKKISRLTADWWQWQEVFFPGFAFGDGDIDCSIGQAGKVWFLGGSDGSGPVTRNCTNTIPRNKSLLFPLVNVNVFNEPLTVTEKRALMSGILSETEAGIFNSRSCLLDATVDDDPVVFTTPILRVQTPPHEYDGDPEAIADGLWVLLPPLSGGDHTIKFRGGVCSLDDGSPLIEVDVTYNLTVRGKK